MTLVLPARLERALWQHAEREQPRECVGVLGGLTEGEAARAYALYPLPNVAADPLREYLADPGGLVRALKAMEREGLSLVALYHSHPNGPARPSRTDTQLARYPLPYLIADLCRRELRAFRLPEARPVTLEILAEEG